MYASDDIVFEPGCFEEALRALAHAPSNIVGGIFYYRNVIAEHPWEFFGIDFLARGLPLLNYGLMNIDVFRAVGGLSSEYAFYCADADLSYKIAAQELILSPLPRSRVVHNNVLDMQKQVNLKGFEADAAVIKNRWNHLGEGEPLYPRRALWNPVLESVFEIALKTRTAPKDLNLLLQTIGLIQIGDQAASQQAFMRLAQSRLPQPVIEKLHQLGAAPAINRAAR
jgi:GT2 family glycosyltransferase